MPGLANQTDRQTGIKNLTTFWQKHPCQFFYFKLYKRNSETYATLPTHNCNFHLQKKVEKGNNFFFSKVLDSHMRNNCSSLNSVAGSTGQTNKVITMMLCPYGMLVSCSINIFRQIKDNISITFLCAVVLKIGLQLLCDAHTVP